MSKTPKLRFFEFSGAWKEYSIGEIFDFYTTNSYSRDCLNDDKGTVKNIHYGDIHMNFSTILDAKIAHIPYINEEIDFNKISEDCYCKEGDVVIADASEDYDDIGKAIEIKNIRDEKIVAGLHTLLARDNKGITQNGYRGYMLLSNNVRKQIKILAVGSKVLGISKSNINKVSVYIPECKEQEKIASFFSLIDEKIEKQKKKIEALKEYKKGIMQKIFSQEIRFKDENGEEYPEWKEMKLGDIAEVITDYVAAGSFESIRNNVTYYSSPNFAQLVRTIDLKNKFNNNEFVFIDENAFQFLYRVNLNRECVILPNIGANIGESYFINQNIIPYKNSVLGPNAILLYSNTNNNNYIYYLLNTKWFYKQLNQMIGASGQPKFNKTELKQMNFTIPYLEEQQKIAQFLSIIDKKIEKEQVKLDSLNEWKKGLLQQMFV